MGVAPRFVSCESARFRRVILSDAVSAVTNGKQCNVKEGKQLDTAHPCELSCCFFSQYQSSKAYRFEDLLKLAEYFVAMASRVSLQLAVEGKEEAAGF